MTLAWITVGLLLILVVFASLLHEVMSDIRDLLRTAEAEAEVNRRFYR